ncbi:thioredoxin family protein [Melioribacteraceae bacterium 4301-Me]|uniref:thioredoxin family protein n=1 Tax=Pyranulibacter aquaticus TaxID=3163344 RepID=UPI003597A047
MKNNKIEIFTAGCPLCNETVKEVESNFSKYEIKIYNMNEKSNLEKSKSYGINKIPAVVVNDNLLDCCKNEKVSIREISEALSN